MTDTKQGEAVKVAKKARNGNSEAQDAQEAAVPEEAASVPENGSNEAVQDDSAEKQTATGIKTQAGDKDVVEKTDGEKATEKQEITQEEVFPSLFIEESERLRINAQILFDPETKRPQLIVAVAEGQEPTGKLQYLKRFMVWAEFTHPTYDDMLTYREQAMTWDARTRQFLSDPVKLRLFYLRYHLKDWSVVDAKGQTVKLEFDGGSLTDECMSRVGGITPSLMDVLLTEFERQALLT